jgi:hypothetical protein
VVPCIVVVMLLVDLLRKGSWRRALVSLGVAVAAVAAVAVPYMLLIGDVTKKKRLLDMLNPSGLIAGLPAGLGTLVQQIFESMHPLLGALLCVWLVAFLIGLLRRKSNGPDFIRPAAPTGAWMLIVLATWAMMMISLKRTAGYMSYRHVMFLAIALLPLAGQGLVILAHWLRAVLGRLAPPAGAIAIVFGGILAAHALHDPLYRGIGAYQAAAAHLASLAKPGDGIVTDTRSAEFELLDMQKESELQGIRLDWRVVRLPAGLRPDEIPAFMDQYHAAWAVIQLARAARGTEAWLTHIGQVGLSDLASWPISNSPDDLHLQARSPVPGSATRP